MRLRWDSYTVYKGKETILYEDDYNFVIPIYDEKMIDDKELDLIIRCVKGNTKNNTESIEDILDRITDEMIENLFKEKWSDK